MSGEGGEKAAVTSYSLEVYWWPCWEGGGARLNQYPIDYSGVSSSKTLVPLVIIKAKISITLIQKLLYSETCI